MDSELKESIDKYCKDGDEALKTLNSYIVNKHLCKIILACDPSAWEILLTHHLQPAFAMK